MKLLPGQTCSSYRTGAAALIAVRWLRSGAEPTGRRGSAIILHSNE
jgi:ornithine cyclodeaminase/alanine dehydrogenase-like protein (mu-crystallin family)